MYRNLVDDNKVRNAAHSVVSPLLAGPASESSEKTIQDHDEVSHDGDEDVCTAQTGKEGEVQEQERGGDAPVYVASPVYLAIDVLSGVGGVLVRLLDDDVVEGDAVTSCHGKVGDGSESGDEGGQDVEQPFLLWRLAKILLRGWRMMLLPTTGTRKAIT